MTTLHREFQWLRWNCSADFWTEKIVGSPICYNNSDQKDNISINFVSRRTWKATLKVCTGSLPREKVAQGEECWIKCCWKRRKPWKWSEKTFPDWWKWVISCAVCELNLEHQVWAWQKRAPIALKIHPQDLSHIVEGCHNVQPWSPNRSFILNELLLCYKIAKNGCQFLYL